MNESVETNDVKAEPVPLIEHDAVIALMERQVRRLFILCIIIFAAFVVTNVGWIVYENSFEDVTLTQEASADNGSDLVINGVGSGEVIYHGSESETDDQSPSEESP